MAKRQQSTPAPLDADWLKPEDGWYELDLLVRTTFGLKEQGVYVIGCPKYVKPDARTLKYETISVGEGGIGERLGAKAASDKVIKRANGRTMYATFVLLDDRTNDYRRAVELYLGVYYGLDQLGDRFHTGLKPVSIKPPWPR